MGCNVRAPAHDAGCVSKTQRTTKAAAGNESSLNFDLGEAMPVLRDHLAERRITVRTQAYCEDIQRGSTAEACQDRSAERFLIDLYQ